MRLGMAVVVGAVVAFVWSAISWMALGWHNLDMKTFSQGGQIVSEALRMETVEPGIYLVPNMSESDHGNEEKSREWQEKAAAGPFAFMSVRPSGNAFSMGAGMAIQFLTQLIVAVIVALVLLRLGGGMLSQGLSAALIVSAGAVLAHLPYWNWWGFPLGLTAVNIVDSAVTWFLAGLAMAKLLPPRPTV